MTAMLCAGSKKENRKNCISLGMQAMFIEVEGNQKSQMM
jgi:hypothetical protein